MRSSNGYVTVVSGLPRSGTSMMMRMLEKGGIPALYDGLRMADHDNPEGYYEYEPVKALPQEKGWVAGAVGKTVKVIYKLVYELPSDVAYRIVFMVRDLNEVVASQNRMLARSGAPVGENASRQFAALFEAELAEFTAWAAEQPNIRILYVDHGRTLTEPQSIAAEIGRFLGRTLDIAAMASVVDPALYRNRA